MKSNLNNFRRCLDLDIHFEVNPLSSVLTGSVSMEAAATMRHPMVTFAKDNANFSISTDDPSITGNRLDVSSREFLIVTIFI